MAAQFATFSLCGLHFGIAVLQVQEVIRFQRMTRVPLAPPAVEGLINLRGEIVTALDLRKRLGLPARSADAQPTNVVVQTDEGAVSLLVDDVGDVVDVDANQFEPVPETVDRDVADLVTGVYKLNDRLLLVLDVAQTVSLESDRAVAASGHPRVAHRTD